MIVPRQDVRRAAGRTLIVGFEGKTLSHELKELIREIQPAGLILFDRNFESPAHLAAFARELKSWRPKDPLLLCIDQEGGRVARIKEPATRWPAMRTLGQIDDASLAHRVGVAIGREVRAVNVDVDLAPALDVDTNPANPVIGERAFSADPQVVARLGTALLQGLHSGGVGSCGKHFPGHGDTDLDSHLALPHVGHDPARLRKIEWAPFRAAIAGGADAIMTAHIVTECLDSTRPATLAEAVLRPLRDEMGFSGVIVSDDVEMKAVAEHFTPAQIAEYGLNAGIDVFLACRREEVSLALYRGVVQCIEQATVRIETLLRAEDRVVTWRHQHYAEAACSDRVSSVLGCAEHQALVAEISARAAQLV
jgi:beta-N-acetylhexosaminidase